MKKKSYYLMNTIACGFMLAHLVNCWKCEVNYGNTDMSLDKDEYIEVIITCPSDFLADIEILLAPFV